jgi:hypothetical protein
MKNTKIRVRYCFKKGGGGSLFPDLSSLPQNKQTTKYLRSCMSFSYDDCETESYEVMGAVLVDDGLKKSSFGDGIKVSKGEVVGYPTPVVDYLVKGLVEDTENFLHEIWDKSYKVEIPELLTEDEEPFYFEDHNGYTEIINVDDSGSEQAGGTPAVDGAPTVFILDFDLEQTHDEELAELEGGSPEEMALIEKIGKGYESGLAQRVEKLLGWTLKKTVGSPDPFRTCSLIFSGEGSLQDHDQALLELSGSEEVYFSAVDLTHEIMQGYDDGDYETGAIACPADSASYAEAARELGERLGLVSVGK